MVLTVRTAAAAAYFAALVYSTVFLKKNKRPSYFKCAFYGLIPLCLGGFFQLALEISPSLQSGFSLGVLGEVSAYIFVTTANTAFIVKEESEQERHLSLPGLLCAGAGLVILLVRVICRFTAAALLSALLYAAAMCPCLYFSAEVCVNRFHNPFKAAVRHFNLLVIVHILAAALFAFVPVLPFAAGTVLTILCGLGWFVPGLAGMYVLKKGLEPWEL